MLGIFSAIGSALYKFVGNLYIDYCDGSDAAKALVRGETTYIDYEGKTRLATNHHVAVERYKSDGDLILVDSKTGKQVHNYSAEQRYMENVGLLPWQINSRNEAIEKGERFYLIKFKDGLGTHNIYMDLQTGKKCVLRRTAAFCRYFTTLDGEFVAFQSKERTDERGKKYFDKAKNDPTSGAYDDI